MLETGVAMFDYFSNFARRTVLLAIEAADAEGSKVIDSSHFIYGMTQEGAGTASLAFQEQDIDLVRFRRILCPSLDPAVALVPCYEDDDPRRKLPFTQDCKAVMERGFRIALKSKHDVVSTGDLFLGALEVSEQVRDAAASIGLDIEAFSRAVGHLDGHLVGYLARAKS